MQFTFDKFNRYEIPRAFLCNPNFVELYPITPAIGPKLSMRFNDISEMTFEIYEKDEKGNTAPCYPMLQKNMIVMLDGFGYWVIASVARHMDGTTEKKTVRCMSYEYTLCQREANIDAGTYNFYNPISPVSGETLLYKLINDIPSWTIGNIDADLIGKYRTFDMPDGESIYSFLTVDVAEAYECIFSFDSDVVDGRVVHRINAKPVPESLTDTEIVLRWNNLLKEVDIEETDSKIVTQLAVYGSGSLSVASINPLGTPRIYHFDPFAYDGTDQWMSEALWTKVNEWQNEVETQLEEAPLGEPPTYKDYVTLVNTANYNLLFATSKQNKAQGMYVDSAQNILDAETPYSLINNTTASNALDGIYNWIDSRSNAELKTWFEASTAYPLISLGVNGEAVQPSAIATYANAITNNSDKIICQALANKHAAESIVDVYKADVATQESSISNYKNSMAAIASSLSFGAYFGDELCVELDKYLFGDTYTNEHFVALSMDSYMDSIAQNEDPDAPYYETDEEYGCLHYYDYIQSITQELYAEAKNVLKRISEHTYTFKLSAINFMFLSEYEKYINDFALGCQIHAEIREDDWVSPIILQVDFDYSAPDDFSLTFGNRFRLQTAEYLYNDLKDQISRTSGTLTANFNDLIKPKREGLYDEMQEFIKGALDAAKNNVTSGTNQELVIDGHGLLSRRFENNAYAAEQIKMLNNGLFFTTDAWKNCAMAVGKVTLNGSDYYGVVAEAIVGNLIAGNNMVISNTIGTYKIDGTGFCYDTRTGGAANGAVVKIGNFAYSGNNYIFGLGKVTGAGMGGFIPKIRMKSNGEIEIDGSLVATIGDWSTDAYDGFSRTLSGISVPGTNIVGGFARVGSNSNNPTLSSHAFSAGTRVNNSGTVTDDTKFSVNYKGELNAIDGTLQGTFKMLPSEMTYRVPDGPPVTTNSLTTTILQGGLIGFTDLSMSVWADYFGHIGCRLENPSSPTSARIFEVLATTANRLSLRKQNSEVYLDGSNIHLSGYVYLDSL